MAPGPPSRLRLARERASREVQAGDGVRQGADVPLAVGRDVAKVGDFGDRLSRPAADQSYRLMTNLFVRYLERLIKASVDGRAEHFTDQMEQKALAHVTAHGALDDWFLVWENLRRLFARADAVALDTRSA